MNKTSTGIVVLCLAIAGAPAAAQTSPSGGIGNLAPPPQASTPRTSDQAQNPPGGERGGDRTGDEKSPRASQ